MDQFSPGEHKIRTALHQQPQSANTPGTTHPKEILVPDRPRAVLVYNDNEGTYTITCDSGVSNQSLYKKSNGQATSILSFGDIPGSISTVPASSQLVNNDDGDAVVANLKQVDGTRGKQNISETFLSKESGGYVCDMPNCGRKFTTIGYLKFHQEAHSSQKPFICEYPECGRKFSWSSHYKYHMLSHKQERLFPCCAANCKQSFLTKQRLLVHMRTHTGERPFECGFPKCNKTFTTAGNMRNHMRIHTGERPFQCQECGRGFTEQSSLKKHLLVHSGEKPFSCGICSKKFSQSGTRNNHLKMHRLETENAYLVNGVRLEPDQADLLPFHAGMEFHEDLNRPSSVVYSPAATDRVLTVSTQPTKKSCTQLPMSQALIGSTDKDLLQDGKSTGNVVVMSQPEEIISLNTYTENQHQAKEEIYECDLLQPELDVEIRTELAVEGEVACFVECKPKDGQE